MITNMYVTLQRTSRDRSNQIPEWVFGTDVSVGSGTSLRSLIRLLHPVLLHSIFIAHVFAHIFVFKCFLPLDES